MKRVSKVRPSHRKVKLRLRPWVRNSLKGLFILFVSIFVIDSFIGRVDSKVLDKSIVEVVAIQVSENYNQVSSVEEEEIIEEEEVVERVNYSCSSSSVKTYMDYRAITNTSSNQYRYIRDYMNVSEDGFLYDENGYIGVALGSHFGSIGSKWEIVLDTGITFKVVKIDEKADRHVNNGCQHKEDGSVIEFVIDSSKFKKSSNGYVYSGNFNNNPNFKGKISAVYKID